MVKSHGLYGGVKSFSLQTQLKLCQVVLRLSWGFDKIENSGLEPESNVFELKISYLPTQEDKSKINIINEVDSLLPDNLMFPSIEKLDEFI